MIKKPVDSRGLRALSCRNNAARQQRHSQLHHVESHQAAAVKEPVSITLEDNKRPDGTTPFHRPQGIQWLGTSQSQTHTLSHTWLIHVHCKGGSLSRLPSTPSWQVHMFYPIAKETAGTWDDMAIES